MIEEVKNWLNIAENDLQVAKKVFMVDENLTTAICFHCQQAVEKYLKAYLVFNNVKPKKIHNIYELLIDCKKLDNDFELLENIQIDKLTIYATELRYPDNFYIPTLDEAKEAIELAEKTKEFVIKKFGK